MSTIGQIREIKKFPLLFEHNSCTLNSEGKCIPPRGTPVLIFPTLDVDGWEHKTNCERTSYVLIYIYIYRGRSFRKPIGN